MIKNVILLSVLLTSCFNQGNSSIASDEKKIDSLFYFHYKHTQEINHEKSIKFMQELTNIKSKASGDWYGIDIATKEDLKNWEGWFKKNRQNLQWNNESKTIRVQK
jgi:hypothetical protein